MSRALILLGYLWAAIRAVWRLKGLWVEFIGLAADAGNAYTDKCFSRGEWLHLADRSWRIMLAGGFACDGEPEQFQGDQGGMPIRQQSKDHVAAPQQVQSRPYPWPDDAGDPWSR